MTNTTDKELLELAAKAAGIDASWNDDNEYNIDYSAKHEGMYLNGERTPDNDAYWNPLRSDGDALRLAVRLGMNLVICDELGITDARIPSKTGWKAEEHWNNGDSVVGISATRRAIVRAAAEIGRGM